MVKIKDKYQVATIIAIFFHLIGLIGILLNKEAFVKYTPVNLLISCVLLVWTQESKNRFFVFFLLITFLTGFFVEVIGVHTAWLFGVYNYGVVLGPTLLQVPVLIGVNWIIIIYCCGISTHTLLIKAINRAGLRNAGVRPSIKALSVVVDGATLAVAFDWLMEPVAVKLGFWTWSGTEGIPIYNYICWFVVSGVLLAVFHFLRFSKHNKFAINLLLVQALFFLLLRTFLSE